MEVTASFAKEVRDLSSAKRAHLIRHIDGERVGVLTGAEFIQTTGALIRLNLVMAMPHNQARPRYTIATEAGRHAIAILLADAADALVRAGVLDAGPPEETPMDVLRRLKAAKQRANQLKLLEAGLPGVPTPPSQHSNIIAQKVVDFWPRPRKRVPAILGTKVPSLEDHMSEQVTTIAEAFSEVLREWLTPDEFAEMKRLNESDPDYADGGACASHNYCDANMAMDAAFQKILGREPNVVGEGPDVEADCKLWNDAWSLARKQHIGSQQ
jgi:hypothetical protein